MTLSHSYAALFREDSSKESLNRILSYMNFRGHMSLLPQIVRILEREPKRVDATVLVAREIDKNRYKKDIESSLTELGAMNHVVEIDSTIVGGFIVRAKTRVIDRSFRRSLVSIYYKAIDR